MVKVLRVPYDTIKERILETHSLEDLIEILGLTSEDILEAFEERVLENLDDLDITTELDYSDDRE